MIPKSEFSKLAVISLIIAGTALVYIFVYFFIYKPLDNDFSSFNSTPIINSQELSNGYTLISPYNRLLADKPDWQGKIYLLDMLGMPIHSWTTDKQAFYSELKPDGTLLTVMEQPKYSEFFPPGGNTGIIEERDWDSNVTWEYKNEAMHHDVAQLPNGNLAVPLWEKTPPGIAGQVQGGVEGTEMENGLIWSDQIVEIDREGKIVWFWHSYEHLDPQADIIAPLLPRYGWTYINGLKYLEENPIDGRQAYLVSMRSISTVMIVRREDGEIIWRSPKGMLSLQHDPTLLDNGNILVFDNGYDRLPNPFPSYGSRVVEINPKTNEIVWEFMAGEGVIDKARFFSVIVGGAQRLGNGNTLITDGLRGHIFEVTKDKELVWDFISPYNTQQTGAFPNNFLFKARRYSEDEIKWPKKIPSAYDEIKINLHKFLDKIYF